jgi:hypothetical protein
MSQEIKIQLDQRSGILDLICGEAQFNRLRDLVTDEAAVGGQIDVPPTDGVRVIMLRLASAKTKQLRMRPPWVCRLAAYFSLAATIVGYAVMVQWIMRWLG